ncbi:host specificity protein, partial [Acinetobacter sp. ULE_I057]
RVDVAESDASIAKTNAASALSKANTAVTDSSAAASMAQQANATATSAKSTADNALTNSATALSKADVAVTNASSAVSKVDAVEAKLGNYATTGALSAVDSKVADVDNKLTATTTKVDGVYAQVNPTLIGSESELIGYSGGYAGVWSEQSARIEGDLAQSIRTDQVTAQMNQNDALYQQQIKATADAVSANVSATTILQTKVGENTASIQTQQSSINGLQAKATIQVAAGNTVGGVAIGNDGGVVDFIVRANKFAIAPPEGINGSSKYAFVYQSTPTELPNGTIVPAGLYLDNASVGYISASKIYADNLSAISANLGTFTSSNSNGTTTITGSYIEVKDSQNRVRVKIGVW